MSRFTTIPRPGQPGSSLGTVTIALGCFLIAACGTDDPTPVGPLPSPTVVNVEVTTRTLGEALDPDGYGIRIDDLSVRNYPSNGTSEIAGVSLGIHSLRLTGISANCSSNASNPQNVLVTSEGPNNVVFEVQCAAWAVLEVSTATDGKDLDTDGYGLYLDGEPSQPMGPDTTLELDRGAGIHTLSLGDVASNCSVTGADPLAVTVPPGDTVRATFEVTCTSFSSGRIAVTTHTTTPFDPDLYDSDGYSVSLDGEAGRAIGVSATVIFSEVPPGVHSVTLSGMSAGCGFWLRNPQNVSVAAGALANVRFDVVCVP
jgi:hypothetical protein